MAASAVPLKGHAAVAARYNAVDSRLLGDPGYSVAGLRVGPAQRLHSVLVVHLRLCISAYVGADVAADHRRPPALVVRYELCIAQLRDPVRIGSHDALRARELETLTQGESSTHG